jgi:tetratricopeptide (TPR) repeat protein
VLAAVLYIGILFDRGTVTLDHLLGGVTKNGLGAPPPPPAADAEFKRELARAIELAEAALKKRPHDIDARFDAGSAYALQASYTASIEGSLTSAFRSARRAYDAQETVLEGDPTRASAGVVVGTYRYLVSGLAVPTRMFAYVMGFGGGKEKGISLLQAAAHERDARVEARTALLLIYTRERRHADALRVARELEADYPRNRLFTLEVGSSALRADQFAEAEAVFSRGLAAFDQDPRRKLAGERGLWLYKRGAARVRLNRLADARVDLDTALTHSPPTWVRGRILMELGKIADLGGNRADAVAIYKQARVAAASVEDTLGLAAIDQWLRRPYTLPGK